MAASFLLVIFFIFHFDHIEDFGLGTFIDGAKGGSVRVEMFRGV